MNNHIYCSPNTLIPFWFDNNSGRCKLRAKFTLSKSITETNDFKLARENGHSRTDEEILERERE